MKTEKEKLIRSIEKARTYVGESSLAGIFRSVTNLLKKMMEFGYDIIELDNEIILLKGQHKELKKLERLRIETTEDLLVRKNKLRSSLLEIINELKGVVEQVDISPMEKAPLPYFADTETEIKIDEDILEFTPERQRSFLRMIAANLDFHGAIKIKKLSSGSIHMTLLLMYEYARKLEVLVEQNKLSNFGVVKARIINQYDSPIDFNSPQEYQQIKEVESLKQLIDFKKQEFSKKEALLVYQQENRSNWFNDVLHSRKNYDLITEFLEEIILFSKELKDRKDGIYYLLQYTHLKIDSGNNRSLSDVDVNEVQNYLVLQLSEK